MSPRPLKRLAKSTPVSAPLRKRRVPFHVLIYHSNHHSNLQPYKRRSQAMKFSGGWENKGGWSNLGRQLLPMWCVFTKSLFRSLLTCSQHLCHPQLPSHRCTFGIRHHNTCGLAYHWLLYRGTQDNIMTHDSVRNTTGRFVNPTTSRRI